ncbi:MAG: hypothetical protein EOM25_03790 [Deltaproteobacteria bacterium]|nr:hypothetical protein [Deltaproteobacteria bacterium]
MDQDRKLALQVAKEIVVKFVETGRISPANFQEHFGPIYREVLRTLEDQTPNSADNPEDRDL